MARFGLLPVEVASGPLAGRTVLVPVEAGEVPSAVVLEALGGPDDGSEIYVERGSALDRCEAVRFGSFERADVVHVYRRDGDRLVHEGDERAPVPGAS